MNVSVIGAILTPLLPKLRQVVDDADVEQLAGDVGTHLADMIGEDAIRRAKMADLLRAIAEVLDTDPSEAM